MIRARAQFVLGMLVGAAITALVGGGSDRAGARAAQPAAAAAPAKVLLENARVRVREVTFPPGAGDTAPHTHELPHVGVILTPGTLAFREPGKPAESVAFEVGSVGYREANVTHQVTNPGRAPMRVIEVELK